MPYAMDFSGCSESFPQFRKYLFYFSIQTETHQNEFHSSEAYFDFYALKVCFRSWFWKKKKMLVHSIRIALKICRFTFFDFVKCLCLPRSYSQTEYYIFDKYIWPYDLMLGTHLKNIFLFNQQARLNERKQRSPH